MPRPSIAECLTSNLETHVECVPRPRQWGGFRATKPAELLLFYSGANNRQSDRGDHYQNGSQGAR
jgi:pyridoxine/pyridoxamine 5'-phosphate oxidase